MFKHHFKALFIVLTSINKATITLSYLFTLYISQYIPLFFTLFLLTSFTTVFVSSYIKKKNELNLLKRFVLGFISSVLILSSFICFFSSEYSVKRVYLEKDDKTIVIQGMIHYASEDFYKEVNSFISDLREDNYIHLYEGLKVLPEHEKVFDTKVQRLIKDNLNSNLKSQSLYFDMYNEDFRADIDSDELLEKLNDNGFITNRNELSVNMLQTENNIKISYLDTILKIGLNVGEFVDVHKLIDFLSDTNIKETVIDLRNEKVVSVALEKIKTNDVVISYGNAHINGIIELLKQNGFKVYNTENVLAIK